MSDDPELEYAILGGGCFWCLEAVYENVAGVVEVRSGYAGGELESPTYEQVCAGLSNHAEVVRIGFDRNRVSYEEILNWFWKIHDPTTRDRQGADVGRQYRSVVFYLGEEQKRLAEESLHAEQRRLVEPIVTELLPAPVFWPAEDYHQQYFKRHPESGYCRVVIAPKVKKAGF